MKPLAYDVTTNVVVSTDRRVYHVTLDSAPRPSAPQRGGGGDLNPQSRYARHVRFYYPDNALAALAAAESGAPITFSRWLRLVVATSLVAVTRARPMTVGGGGGESRVLFLLDEFAQLGPMAPVRRAVSLMAGYGVQVWPFLQDLGQLKQTYPKKRRSSPTPTWSRPPGRRTSSRPSTSRR